MDQVGNAFLSYKVVIIVPPAIEYHVVHTEIPPSMFDVDMDIDMHGYQHGH